MNKLKLSKEQKEILIRNVQIFFAEERSEELGNLAADQILEFMLQEIGPFIYNQAIDDAKTMLQEQSLRMEEELYALEKPIHLQRRL